MPREVIEAAMIERVCQRYGCLPSQARREPISTWRHMGLLDAAFGGGE